MSRLHNTRIIWKHMPDDKKKIMLDWLNKYQAKHNVEFHRQRSGLILYVNANLPANVIANLREHTSVHAIKSL